MISKATLLKQIKRAEKKYAYVLDDEDYDDPDTSAWVNGYLEALYELLSDSYDRKRKK